MANLSFPSSLPVASQRQSYSEQLPDIAIRTPMDTGPAKVRLAAPAGIREQNVQLLLTSAQVETFKTFYHDITRDGALPFEFTHQRTEETILVQFRDRPKIGVAGGDIWLVSFQFEHADPLPEADAVPVFLLEGLGFGNASNFLMAGL